MHFVIDNSVVMAIALGEPSVQADAILTRLAHETALAPAIWPIEFANALLTAERRRRITPAQAAHTMAIVQGLGIAVEDALSPERMLGEIHGLARAAQLTVYDTLYLELAMRLGKPLATFDDALARAAVAMGVHLL